MRLARDVPVLIIRSDIPSNVYLANWAHSGCGKICLGTLIRRVGSGGGAGDVFVYSSEYIGLA